MKICFLAGTLARGGAEKQLVFMLRVLKNAGANAEVLCLTRGEAYEDEIRDLGFPVRWVGQAKNRAARLWKIIGSLRWTRPDIIQSSHFYTNLYAGTAAKFLHIPGIGAVRSDLVYEFESHKLTGRWQIALPDLLITNSERARRRLVERGISPEKIEFVRNAVEIGERPPDRRSPQSLKILFAGRLDENKRPERFIRLASVLSDRFPEKKLQFQIAGDGELRGEMELLARELNLTPEKLKFLGVCRSMSEIYRRADILVCTSDREGTPNVVLEAMAHGLPVVATAAGGTTEILDESRGFLIAPGDEKALVRATAELIVNRELRMRLGAAGRLYIVKNHSLCSLQERLTGIYARLSGRF